MSDGNLKKERYSKFRHKPTIPSNPYLALFKLSPFFG